MFPTCYICSRGRMPGFDRETSRIVSGHAVHSATVTGLTAIPFIAANELHRTQWKCSHYATATTSPDYRAHYELNQIAVANNTV